MKVLHK